MLSLTFSSAFFPPKLIVIDVSCFTSLSVTDTRPGDAGGSSFCGDNLGSKDSPRWVVEVWRGGEVYEVKLKSIKITIKKEAVK